VVDLDQGGGVAGGCDGTTNGLSGDLDGTRNGRIRTVRLDPGPFRVKQGQVPAGYLKGKPVDVEAVAGQVHRVTIKVPPRPRILITTTDVATDARLKGACYTISDLTHGGGLGKICDGQQNGTFGDQDGSRNGRILTRPLDANTTYRLHEETPPVGYRAARDKDVKTVAGKDTAVTFANRRAG
jgi:hypothetical protein